MPVTSTGRVSSRCEADAAGVEDGVIGERQARVTEPARGIEQQTWLGGQLRIVECLMGRIATIA